MHRNRFENRKKGKKKKGSSITMFFRVLNEIEKRVIDIYEHHPTSGQAILDGIQFCRQFFVE